MAPATSDRLTARTSPGSRCRLAVWSLARFGLFVLLLSLAISVLILPVLRHLELSWWQGFRRCVSISSALSLWIIVKQLERRPFSSYGLMGWGAGKRQLLAGILLGAGALSCMLAVGLASGVCQLRVTPDRAKLWGTVFGFVPAAFLVSVLEELVFRGFILQHLVACSTPLAVVISSAVYALVHVKTGALSWAIWRELGGLFLLGAVLALSYLRTRHLFLAIGLHAVLAYGARVNKLLLQFPDSSLAWLTGTNRLVNGLMGWFALLVIGGLIYWRAGSSEASSPG